MPRLRLNKEMIKAAGALAEAGNFPTQIFTTLGVSKTAYYTWINKGEAALEKKATGGKLTKTERLYADFANAIKKGEQKAISVVIGSLFKRAVGYEVEETKTFQKVSKTKDGKKVETIRAEKHKKHIAPDVGAIALFLKNKDPEHWKDRREFEFDPAEIIKRLDEVLKD